MTSRPASGSAEQELERLTRAGKWPEALAMYHELGDPAVRRLPRVQLHAARAMGQLGQIEAAALLAARAYHASVDAGDGWGQMQAAQLLGAAAFEGGKLEEASARFRETVGLANQLNDRLMAARAGNNLASIAHLSGHVDEAVALYRSALLIYQDLKHPRGAAETSHNLGLVYRQKQDVAAAEAAANVAVDWAERAGDPGLLALAVLGRAEISLDRGESAFAGVDIERAASLAGAAGDVLGIAEAVRLRAVLLLRTGQYDPARREAEWARALAIGQGCKLLQAESAAVAARALRLLGRSAEAESRKEEALSTFAELTASHLAQRFRTEWEALPAA